MARDLRPGDLVRTLDGPARVRRVEPDASQPVFNLEVAARRVVHGLTFRGAFGGIQAS